jgi:hypothetical protein
VFLFVFFVLFLLFVLCCWFDVDVVLFVILLSVCIAILFDRLFAKFLCLAYLSGRSVFEKMRSEAGSRREEQVVLWESALSVVGPLRRAVGSSTAKTIRDYREHIRGLETRRGTEGWNCAQ